MNDFVNPFLQYDEEGRQDFDLGYLLGQDVAPAPVAAAPAPAVAAPAPAPAPAPAAPPAFALPAGWDTSYVETSSTPGSEELIQQETKSYD